jgi:predicted kinase
MDSFRCRVLPRSNHRVEHRDIAYRAMHFAAEIMAPRCGTLVLDATYTAAAFRVELIQIVNRVGGQLFVVECQVDPAAAADRFAARGRHPAVDLTRTRVAALAADYPYFSGASATLREHDQVLDPTATLTYILNRPLDDIACAAWRSLGQPRARAGEQSRWRAAVETTP